MQIERSILNYGQFVGVRALAIYGGVDIKRQFDTLHRGVDIVVATPGRLMDHMRRGTIDFRSMEVLVLDEADRMFDMGFIDDVRRIIDTLPEERQTMLFSATMPPEVQQLAAGVQKDPQMIQIGEQCNPIETITQHVHAVLRQQKLDLLLHMLQNRPMHSVLVFSRTKHGADKIHRKLEHAGIVGDRAALRAVPVAASACPRRLQETANTRSWSPPTSPPAGSTCGASRMSSISTYPCTRGITSTGSAAPEGPRPQAMRSRSWLPMSRSTCTRSSSSSDSGSSRKNTRGSPVPN